MQLIQNALGRNSHVLFCVLIGESESHTRAGRWEEESGAWGEREQGGREEPPGALLPSLQGSSARWTLPLDTGLGAF